MVNQLVHAPIKSFEDVDGLGSGYPSLIGQIVRKRIGKALLVFSDPHLPVVVIICLLMSIRICYLVICCSHISKDLDSDTTFVRIVRNEHSIRR